MAALVLDSSVAAAAVLPDETSVEAIAIVRRATRESCAAPVLWRYEIGNTLEMAHRRGRLDRGRLESILRMLFSLRVELDESSAIAIRRRILPLAQKHRLTVYDAAYLELSIRLGAPLATLDTALAKAARSEGVRLLLS